MTIREQALEFIRTQLATITISNGYSRDIGPKRVYGIKDTPTEALPPAVFIMQGDETVTNNIGDRFSCELDISIGFVDRARTTEPDQDATKFMAEIQLCLPIEYDIVCQIYPSGNPVPGKIQLIEYSNSINISSALPGFVLGQVAYTMYYRRNIFDPSRF